jgi:hypothetical protein
MLSTDPAAIQSYKNQQPFASLWNLQSTAILDYDGAAQQAQGGRTDLAGGLLLLGD